MNIDQTHPGAEPEAIGLPTRFAAEPVRKKSHRTLFVLLFIFMAIIAAVGLGVWQTKSYFRNSAVARAENQRLEAEKVSAVRPRKTFDLDAGELPDTFHQPKLEPEAPPIAVVKASPTPSVVSATPTVPAPAKRSMLLEFEAPPVIAQTPEDEAKAIATAVAGAINGATPPGEGSSLAGGAPAAAAGGTLPRAKNVQELAQRTQGPATATAQATASHLGNRNYLLARGSSIPCTLQTQLNSTVPGPARCLVSQNVYSDDGKVLLVERGASIDGEYKNTLKTGDSRIAILWQRIKTPNGVVIDVDSQAADSVGTVGIAGDIDNHWFQRIGAAFLLSLVDDAIQLQTAKQGAQSAGANGSAQPYTSTTGTTKSIAEKVLESTINIAPTLTRNRGERLMVLVQRDLWFDNVYQVSTR